MSNEAKPLRSLLFVPGNKEDWMRKAPRFKADALIFDLEDAVPAASRPEARKIVRQVTEELGSQGQTIFVRVNGMDTGETGDDIEAVVCNELHGIFLPKVRGPEDVIGVGALLDHFERRSGVPVGHTLVDPLLETARAANMVYEVATASPRVAYLGGGTAKDGDGARAIGYEWTPQGLETLFARSRTLSEARAAQVPFPISGLWTPIEDLDGLRAFAVQTRQLGYHGMMAIYPGHIPIINEVFSPSPEEIAHWKQVIVSMAAAEAAGTTAIRGEDGHLIDTAHAKTARDRLDLARGWGLTD